jgi:predicted nuclease of restriction endonuclease-like (RecB) superfamily
VFPEEHIVAALIRQLSWTHFRTVIYIDDPLKRDFYAEMCRVERWSTRTLHQKIDSMLYERTAISRESEELIKQELTHLRDADRMSPDLVFRDPYILDFLNLKDTYSEKDLEAAILRELESFLLELGFGFTFVERQKRIVIDDEDHYLDLLFFHRKLKRLIVVELKLGRFKAAYKGQMELYLRWLERYAMEAGEDSPLGLILCAEGSRETIELLQLHATGIHVAEYLTELPPKELLERKLHQAMQQARQQIEHRGNVEEAGI